MKIDGTSISPVGSVQSVNRVSQITNNRPSQQDQVAVSDSAHIYQNLVQKIKELPEIRADKVKSVTEQIERGEFSLDAESIARSILSPDSI